MAQAPKTGSKKAVAFIDIRVLVEIDDAGDYYINLEKALDKLRSHVREGVGFCPFQIDTKMIQDGTTVAELVEKLTIQPSTGWND